MTEAFALLSSSCLERSTTIMLKFSTRTIQGKRKKQKQQQKQKKPTFSRLLWLKRNDQSKVIGCLYFEKDKAIRLVLPYNFR